GPRPVGLVAGEEKPGGLVDEADLSVAIEDEDGVLDLVEERLLELPLLPLGIAEEEGLAHGVADGPVELGEGASGRAGGGEKGAGERGDSAFQMEIAESEPEREGCDDEKGEGR